MKVGLIGGAVDNSASRYIDIGNTRIQWGRGGGGSSSPTITFPVPFKDTNYSFVAMMAAGSASQDFRVVQSTRTVSSMGVTKAFDGGGSSGEWIDWVAIGLKP